MTSEFLKYFLEQKPFRKCRLVRENGVEYIINNPNDVTFIVNNNILLGPDSGMGLQTVNLEYIEEIRQ